MKIALGSDHAGYPLKEAVADFLRTEKVDFQDFGTYSTDSMDYPDIAREVAEEVAKGNYDRGIIICGSGVGVSITANKVKGIRAALCDNSYTARVSREHNDANVLCMGARVIGEDIAFEIVRTWLATPFSGGRHARRVSKIEPSEGGPEKLGLIEVDKCVSSMQASIAEVDPEVAEAIKAEEKRQHDKLVLIASENYTSRAVMEAQGSVLTNKYAEGLAGKRYYGGCEYVDVVERLAIERAKQLFGCDHANVQPHSGSQANMAAYYAVMKPGDTYMALNLAHGGHLTHGSPVNFSGQLYNIVPYGVSEKDETFDYDQIREIALQCNPKLIVTGATAYPRFIDFKRFRDIADEVGAVLMVDMSHIAGLVATGEHPSPVPYAQIVTTTTHKTLRGPRSGIILCSADWAQKIDKAVFPGLQGGPLEHVIAAKAVNFKEAMSDDFKCYQAQIRKNAAALAKTLANRGFRLVSGGTDNHLMLVDLTSKGMTGKAAQQILDDLGIVCNKNMIPFDKESPFVTSGIRIGTPAVTTRGMAEGEMATIGNLIADALTCGGDEAKLASVRQGVKKLCDAFPIYGKQVC